MKKIFLITAITTLLSCNNNTTEEKPKGIKEIDNGLSSVLNVIDYHTSGMHYKVFVTSNGGVTVTNVTKDSIFCQ